MYQKLYEKAKAIIKNDACMKFYYEKEPIYLKTDALDVGLGARLLQARGSLWLSQDKVPDSNGFVLYSICKQELHQLEIRYSTIA